MIPNVEESVLLQDFSLTGGNTQNIPKPEAPWIKRCDYGIKFTDEIQVIEGGASLAQDGVTETEMSTQQNEEREGSSEEETEEHGQNDHDVHHYFQHHQLEEQAAHQENERYYLRSYLKEARRKMIRAYSEQILPKGDCDLFRVGEEEVMLVPDEEDDGEDENPMNIGEDEKIQFREQLYGEQDSDEAKNIVIDDDEL